MRNWSDGIEEHIHGFIKKRRIYKIKDYYFEYRDNDE